MNLDPNYAEAQYGLGWSFYHLDRFEDALEPLLIAINLKPNLGAAYFSLGETHAALGEFEKAIDEFKETIHLIPVKTQRQSIHKNSS